MCWLTNIQPHSSVKHQYDVSLSSTPPQISVFFFFFSSIFLNEKIHFSSYSLIGYADPQQRNYLLVHFLPIMSSPIQQSSLLSLSKLCFLLLSILKRWHLHEVASAPDKYAFPTKSMLQRLLLSSAEKFFPWHSIMSLDINCSFFTLLNIIVIW